MRRWKVALLAVVACVGLAAAAQVTREEFDALRKEVNSLKFTCAQLGVQVKALKAQLEAPAQAEPVPEAPAEPQGFQKLEGRDLIAWKLARDRADREWNRFAEQEAQSLTGSYGARLRARGITPAAVMLIGDPTTEYMQKTDTGDYVFRFTIARMRQGRIIGGKILDIPVTDFGTELRLGEIGWRTLR